MRLTQRKIGAAVYAGNNNALHVLQDDINPGSGWRIDLSRKILSQNTVKRYQRGEAVKLPAAARSLGHRRPGKSC